jgi:cold shock CspA family protein/ribosome-associated translation inhibitor RaiA
MHDVVLKSLPPELRDSVQADVLDRIAALESFSDRITSCRVVVEPSSGRHRLGNPYHVRIDVVLPGREIVVRRDPPEDRSREDVHVAVRDAFDAARRRIEDAMRERFQHKLKEHAAPLQGRVVELLPDADHGFLETGLGARVYFHRHAVVGRGFDSLALGQSVRFVEREGRDGPQASTVEPLGRHPGVAG